MFQKYISLNSVVLLRELSHRRNRNTSGASLPWDESEDAAPK
jgi:hypothetical protein